MHSLTSEICRCRTRPVHCGVRKIKQPDRNQQQGAKSNRPAINDEIRAKEVRLVAADGEQKGLFH
jgi:hypothetical protein